MQTNYFMYAVTCENVASHVCLGETGQTGDVDAEKTVDIPDSGQWSPPDS